MSRLSPPENCLLFWHRIQCIDVIFRNSTVSRTMCSEFQQVIQVSLPHIIWSYCALYSTRLKTLVWCIHSSSTESISQKVTSLISGRKRETSLSACCGHKTPVMTQLAEVLALRAWTLAATNEHTWILFQNKEMIFFHICWLKMWNHKLSFGAFTPANGNEMQITFPICQFVLDLPWPFCSPNDFQVLFAFVPNSVRRT